LPRRGLFWKDDMLGGTGTGSLSHLFLLIVSEEINVKVCQGKKQQYNLPYNAVEYK